MTECSGNCGTCGKEGCGDRSSVQKLALHEGSAIGNIIAIASGKGGVGKSLTTALIACELARQGKRVGILDADVTGPSIPKSFGISSSLEVDETGAMLPAVTKTGIKLISTNMLVPDETTPFLWRGPVLNGIITQFFTDINWGEIDYLLIDMPPGTGDVPMTVFQMLPIDGVVIATAPQSLVKMIVEKAIRMCETMDVPVLALVENMSYFKCPDCGAKHEIFGVSHVEDIAEQKGIKAWARIPIDSSIAKDIDEGQAEQIITNYVDDVVSAIVGL